MPEIAEVRERTLNMDYEGLATTLLALHDRDSRLLTAAASVAADEPSLYDLLVERLRFHPDDILAKALLANSLIFIGWEIRTGHRAENVSREQFEQFHEHLREAEIALIEVCAVEPAWTFPWYLRLLTARGLELGASETRRRYDRLAEHDEHHYPAQAQLLQSLCPKWGGSWEEAFEFARACAAAAPPGSLEYGIVAEVHLEKWMDLDQAEQARYLRRRDVLEELRAAAEASVFHADFTPGFGWVRLHSQFGALLALGGDKGGAARHFAALGEVVDAGVWASVGTADREVIQRARMAGLAMSGTAR